MAGVFRPLTGPRVERLAQDDFQVLGLRELSPRFRSRERAERWMAEQLERVTPARKPRERCCLRCGDRFLSEGFHNRMCDPCRHVSDAVAMGVAQQATAKVRRLAG